MEVTYSALRMSKLRAIARENEVWSNFRLRKDEFNCLFYARHLNGNQLQCLAAGRAECSCERAQFARLPQTEKG